MDTGLVHREIKHLSFWRSMSSANYLYCTSVAAAHLDDVDGQSTEDHLRAAAGEDGGLLLAQILAVEARPIELERGEELNSSCHPEHLRFCNSLSASPSELLASPSELSASPSELLPSPSELSASPSELSASPSELSASPSELSASPSKLSASPSELSASPSELRYDTMGPRVITRVIPTWSWPTRCAELWNPPRERRSCQGQHHRQQEGREEAHGGASLQPAGPGGWGP
jgi:hypothetical protein